MLIPEFPITVERCADMVRPVMRRGRDFSIVVVSEGWPLTHEAGSEGLATQTAELDAFGHVRLGGVGDRLAEELKRLTGVRHPRDGARPPAARRLADRVRPRAGDALRPARRRPGRAAAATA